jgi:hypothetical protein
VPIGKYLFLSPPIFLYFINSNLTAKMLSEICKSPSKDFQSLVSEGLGIVEKSEKLGATLRLMGGVAIRIHTKNHLDLYERLSRRPGDLDFMGRKKIQNESSKL